MPHHCGWRFQVVVGDIGILFKLLQCNFQGLGRGSQTDLVFLVTEESDNSADDDQNKCKSKHGIAPFR